MSRLRTPANVVSLALKMRSEGMGIRAIEFISRSTFAISLAMLSILIILKVYLQILMSGRNQLLLLQVRLQVSPRQ